MRTCVYSFIIYTYLHAKFVRKYLHTCMHNTSVVRIFIVLIRVIKKKLRLVRAQCYITFLLCNNSSTYSAFV